MAVIKQIFKTIQGAYTKHMSKNSQEIQSIHQEINLFSDKEGRHPRILIA